MRKFFVNRFKILCTLCLVAVLSICSAFVFLTPNAVFADSQNSAGWFLPASDLEYVELSNPTDAISADDLTAVMNTNSLTIYYNDAFSSIQGTTFTEIERHKDSILISSESRLHKIDLFNVGNADFVLNKDTMLSDDDAISYFKVNDNYLVTSYATYLRVFSFTNSGVKKIFDKNIIADKSDVAINNNNQVFFITSEGICQINVQDLIEGKTEHTLVSSVKPKKMIATNDFIYYVDNDGNICRLSLNTENAETTENPTPVTFSLDERDASFDLGRLANVKNLAFRNENLLITDEQSVQEYFIDNQNNVLTFTGFALAKNKTAYNRITAQATEIEKYQDTIAILDGATLKVVKINDDIYSRTNFENTVSDLSVEGANPDTFALGKNSALLLYSPNTSSSSLRFSTFGSALSDKIVLPGNFLHIINDVTYQSGYYYVLASNGIDSFIYRAQDGQVEFELLTTVVSAQFSKIAVDVFGNVYLSSSNKISMLEVANSYALSTLRTGTLEIKELRTDLNGGLFALAGNTIYYYTSGKLTVQAVSAQSSKIKSFALDAFSKDVFFIYEQEEFVCKSQNMVNFSFSDLEVPSTFITTGTNADLDFVKVYSANQNANVYNVTKQDNNFKFDKYHKDGGEYLFICTVEHTNGYETLEMFVLASQNSLVLVNKNDAVDVTSSTLNLADAPQTVYITTDVSGYYLPLITVDSEYALTDNGKVKLEKGAKISPLNQLTVLDRNFYFAEFTVNSVTYKGFIPASFTVETLAQDFKWQDYSVEKVCQTGLYSDNGLTQKIFDLDDDSMVRVIEKSDSVVFVAIKNGDGEWIKGYISASAIKDPAGKNVKNILIVFIVAVCVLGTVAFFILRKKKIK